jgi:hypothetical protein
MTLLLMKRLEERHEITV